MKPIYLDHNASTPIEDEVLNTLIRVSRDLFANPSSIEHILGNAAFLEVETAREKISQTIGCRPQEIIFTSGATEANNLAIIGTYKHLIESGRDHFVTSQIEHPSVLACFDYLETLGGRITRLPVSEHGLVSTKDLENCIDARTGLVSVMAANNETGVLQPISKLGIICEAAGALFHTDYSQATAYIPINLESAPIHLASFSGHKAYAPKGVGLLYRSLRKPRVNLEPVLRGGGQENGLRSGTYNTPAIAALGKAFELIDRRRTKDSADISKARDMLEIELNKRIHGLHFNGQNSARLPNTTSVSIDGVEPLALMHKLKNEVVFSASSACSTGKVDTSHVLLAMFGECSRSREAFRLGLGKNTNLNISHIVELFESAVRDLRQQSL
ncbi:MAG: cysteine desulfurase family protein [Sphingorhabdus sp.]